MLYMLLFRASKKETIPIDCAMGRISASPTVSCPPAIPIAVSGEEITEEAVNLFKKYGIREVEVVK
jgi:arginine/lysine/ornithine decarboxylase